jgi:ribosomal protein S18 acetylase RimI-like enzyme
MDEYNAAAGVPDRSRVEYASQELLARFDPRGYELAPLAADYVYSTPSMIELAGGDLKSKRQERNRFVRNYPHFVEDYDPARHLNACLALLDSWKKHQDDRHAYEGATSALKRRKEALATELALRHSPELGLRGMVVYAADSPADAASVRGFTLGEHLGTDQASIVVEKTDLACKGLAQFIFSEFCRRHWSDRPLINAGDDWGLETLAWTKQSYRPIKRLMKWTLRAPTRAAVSLAAEPPQATQNPIEIRPARIEDLPQSLELESACFDAYQLKKRQLQYLMHSRGSVFVVAERDGRLVGQGIALIRHHRKGCTGRIYSLAVSADCRGRGLGHALLRRLIETLGARGVNRIYLEVERANTAAVKLYERNGFRRVGILPDYYGLGRDALHMLCVVPVEPGLFDSPTPVAA